MKCSLRIVFLGVVLVGLFRVVPCEAQSFRSTQIDGVVALVNTQVVTKGELMMYVQPVEMQLREIYSGEDLAVQTAEAYSNALEQLIDKALIVEEFKRQQGSISDRALTDYINGIIHDRFDDDRVKLMSLLARERMTFEEWRDSMRDNLIVSIMRQNEVMNRVVIAPSALREAYEARMESLRVPAKVKLSIIVLQRGTSDEDRAVKREEAEALLAKLRVGEDFSTLAREHSEGPKADEGGALGWMSLADLRPELREAIALIQPGSVTKVIETEDELYVVQLDGIRQASVRSFDDVRAELEEELRRKEAERLYTEWLSRLRQRFHVVIYESN